MRNKYRKQAPYAEMGKRLKALREACGQTQVEFARSNGLSQATLAECENGKRRLGLNKALELCERHKISLDWLYRGKR